MMSVMEHMESLKTKHHDLENLIEQEEARPRPDEAKINELKRQKLQNQRRNHPTRPTLKRLHIAKFAIPDGHAAALARRQRGLAASAPHR